MHTAANFGNEFTMEGLLKRGADIEMKDINGVSETVLNLSSPFSKEDPSSSVHR